MKWVEEGLKHIWLPYTQMKRRPDPLLPVIGGEGCNIILSDGRKIIDGISSWWSVCHGYSNPHIINAITQQAQKLAHVMLAGCAHEQAYVLAQRLANLLPKSLNRVFFSDSGSVAVEVALKIAVQYFHNLNKPEKCKFINFHNSYHGDTAGCMSISSTCIQGKTFHKHISTQYSVPISTDLIELKNTLQTQHEEIAGVIIEPILQGAGGMKLHSNDILKMIYQITKEYDVLFIADEIATGFYRLGKRFACDFVQITPDIITLGKGLSGGMCGIGVTIATDKIFNTFLSDKLEHALMHGPTFMGNPIACAAVNASLDLFENNNYEQKVAKIEKQLHTELMPCKQHNKVTDVRVIGAVGVVEIEASWDKILKLRKEAVKLGAFVRPFNNVIYLMPPFIINEQELTKLTTAVRLLVELL